MTLVEFNALKPKEQIEKVYSEGVFIDDRLEREFTIVRYKVDEVCVDIYYEESDIQPIGLKSFTCQEQFQYSILEAVA